MKLMRYGFILLKDIRQRSGKNSFYHFRRLIFNSPGLHNGAINRLHKWVLRLVVKVFHGVLHVRDAKDVIHSSEGSVKIAFSLILLFKWQSHPLSLNHLSARNTFLNVYKKQACGFLLEILSILTSFVKKRVKNGKWSNQCLQVALFHDFHSNYLRKTLFMIEIMSLIVLFDD